MKLFDENLEKKESAKKKAGVPYDTAQEYREHLVSICGELYVNEIIRRVPGPVGQLRRHCSLAVCNDGLNNRHRLALESESYERTRAYAESNFPYWC